MHGARHARQCAQSTATGWRIGALAFALCVAACQPESRTTAPTGSPTGQTTSAATSHGAEAPADASARRPTATASPARAAEGGAPQDAVFTAMGGIDVRLRVWNAEPASLERALPACRRLVEQLEQQLSGYHTASDIARLNGSNGRAVTVGAPARELLGRALEWSHRTGGAFDPTVGPLISLWRSAARADRWPAQAELAQARRWVGVHHLTMGPGGVVKLAGDARIDLGAIAKGYIADRIAAYLQARALQRGRVEIGGDVRLFDRGARPRPFRIGIRHPVTGGVLATIEVEAGGVATSGCTERYAEVAGRRVCHVVDPRTGLPVAGGLSATIVAHDATDADALATAVLALGAAEGRQLVESLPHVDAVLAVERGGPKQRGDRAGMTVLVTSGLVTRIAWPQPAGGPRAGASSSPLRR